MPNRIIRESCRTSPNLDQLSGEAERMFWRLTTVADDYGRFEADARVVMAACFPLKVDRMRVATVRKWLQELSVTGTIVLYEVEGRAYGYFPSWGRHQRTRAAKSKHPQPPADIGQQPPSNAAVVRSRESRVEESEQPSAGGEGPPITRTPKGFVAREEVLALWRTTYPGVDVDAQLREAFAWEQADPKRRKIRLRPFLTSWLAREQDRAPAKGNGPVVVAKDRPDRLTDPPDLRPMTPEEREKIARFTSGVTSTMGRTG